MFLVIKDDYIIVLLMIVYEVCSVLVPLMQFLYPTLQISLMVQLQVKIENMGFLCSSVAMLSRGLRHGQVARVDLQLKNNSSTQFGNNFRTTDLQHNSWANEDESEDSKTWLLFLI
jgi:hypothetical protein